jgi:hypothetical protein
VSVSWIATATLTAELPNAGGLRAAAYTLRSAGDTLGSQASVTRSVADAIGPGVWQDDAAGQARSILNELGTELADGSSALYQAAEALDVLAGYVDGQSLRYEETGRQLEQLALDPLGTIAHHELLEAEQLIEERRGIEQSVSSAMGHASDVINQAAARATRYHGSGGRSFWASVEHDVADYFKTVWHADTDLLSGIWDGTYELGKGIVETAWSLFVLSAKLSPERLLVDPKGYVHDYEHAIQTGVTTADYLAHHKQQFVSNLLNLHELRTDPIHWFGELVPTIVAIIATKGVTGLGAKGADGTVAVDETATAAGSASRVSAADLTMQDDFSLSRYENVQGATGQTGGHTFEWHINTSGLPNESYIRTLGRTTDGIWSSPETADDAAKLVLSAYSDDITSYLANPGAAPLTLQATFEDPIGIALHQGDPIVRIADRAIFIIRPAPQMPERFIVQTAYPAYDPSYPAYIP